MQFIISIIIGGPGMPILNQLNLNNNLFSYKILSILPIIVVIKVFKWRNALVAVVHLQVTLWKYK